ncbi:MAG: hypothetical protein EOL95_01385 [Bacteroidia bacterium]|nr:hypothetical protein [Bacteroidia bacterium]
MKNSTAKVLLADLENRIQANQNGLLVLVKEAGIPTEKVCVKDLEILYNMKAPQLKECINILYPELKNKINMQMFANATGATDKTDSGVGFDYFSFFGNVLGGIGLGLSSQSGIGNMFGGGSSSSTQQQAQYEAELAAQEAAAQQKRTLIIVSVIVALIVVAGVVVFVVRGRK